jgi:hypothetical protein
VTADLLRWQCWAGLGVAAVGDGRGAGAAGARIAEVYCDAATTDRCWPVRFRSAWPRSALACHPCFVEGPRSRYRLGRHYFSR